MQQKASIYLEEESSRDDRWRSLAKQKTSVLETQVWLYYIQASKARITEKVFYAPIKEIW